MAVRRVFLRFMRSKLGFTFVVILVLSLFLLMLNSYSSDAVQSGEDSGPRRGLSAFVDDEGVYHPGTHRHRKHRKQNKDDMEIQVCQIPKLSLDNDANKHAYTRLDQLECKGEELFYSRKGEIHLNRTVLRGRKIDRCEYSGIEWGSDRYPEETKPHIEREEPFAFIILHDFIRVKCYLKKSKGSHHRKLLSDSQDSIREVGQNQQQPVGQEKWTL